MNKLPQPVLVARKLCHDVGKYLTRAARNIGDAKVEGPLLALMLDDLFALDGERRASLVFEDITLPLEALIGKNAHLEACRTMLLRIDALESDIRAEKAAAIKEASTLAVEIEDRLRRLLLELTADDAPAAE